MIKRIVFLGTASLGLAACGGDNSNPAPDVPPVVAAPTPSMAPTMLPSPSPTMTPSTEPSMEPSPSPSMEPSPSPSMEPSPTRDPLLITSFEDAAADDLYLINDDTGIVVTDGVGITDGTRAIRAVLTDDNTYQKIFSIDAERFKELLNSGQSLSLDVTYEEGGSDYGGLAFTYATMRDNGNFYQFESPSFLTASSPTTLTYSFDFKAGDPELTFAEAAAADQERIRIEFFANKAMTRTGTLTVDNIRISEGPVTLEGTSPPPTDTPDPDPTPTPTPTPSPTPSPTPAATVTSVTSFEDGQISFDPKNNNDPATVTTATITGSAADGVTEGNSAAQTTMAAGNTFDPILRVQLGDVKSSIANDSVIKFDVLFTRDDASTYNAGTDYSSLRLAYFDNSTGTYNQYESLDVQIGGTNDGVQLTGSWPVNTQVDGSTTGTSLFELIQDETSFRIDIVSNSSGTEAGTYVFDNFRVETPPQLLLE